MVLHCCIGVANHVEMLLRLDSGEAVAAASAKRKERESSDDVPPISLDERLREITGEAPPEQPSPPESPKPVEDASEVNPMQC